MSEEIVEELTKKGIIDLFKKMSLKYQDVSNLKNVLITNLKNTSGKFRPHKKQYVICTFERRMAYKKLKSLLRENEYVAGATEYSINNVCKKIIITVFR